MANKKITLSSVSSTGKSNTYYDVDVSAKYLENTLVDRKAIENSINNILTWRPRERIMLPGFGNTLLNYLFENYSTMSKSEIKNAVRRVLTWEPRINVEDVDVSMEPDSNKMNISFTYSIPLLEKNTENKVLSTYSLTIS